MLQSVDNAGLLGLAAIDQSRPLRSVTVNVGSKVEAADGV